MKKERYVRLEEGVWERVEALAKEEHRSRANMMERLLNEALEAREPKGPWYTQLSKEQREVIREAMESSGWEEPK